MAKGTGLAQNFYAGGYDLSGDVGAISVAGSPRATYDVTGLNKSAHERLLGHGDGKLGFNTYFNDSALQAHAALKGLPATDAQIVWAFAATIGAVAAGLVAKQINYDWSRPIDGSLVGTIEAIADGVPLEWGELLTAGKRTDTAATNGASLDNAALSSDGLAAYLQVFAVNAVDVTIKVQDSADDAAWADIITFTAPTGVTFERKTLTGTIRRYLRVITETTGGITSVSFAVMVRRGTAEDDEAYTTG